MKEFKPIEKFHLDNIKNIIIVASGKGGVGKSTVAAGIALSLAKKGYKTGLMDADIYGPSTPTLFHLQNEHPISEDKDGKTWIIPFERAGIKIMSLGFFINPEQAVLWRGPMATNALKQLLNETAWGELDYLILDTPPGTGDIHITLVQQYEINGVIIVTTPQLIALADVQKCIGLYNASNIQIPILGIVENMAWFTPSRHPDEKYFLFGKGGGESLSKQFNIPVIAQIPMNENICNQCDGGLLEEMLQEKEMDGNFEQLLKSFI
ncbi:MAG: Mrp/NBP35 family ATP-binding protein [Bacteroidales bacterium]|nr:Mrp/NBP35 family ATP-binding protein [Bacteroidales bacterium]